MSNWTIPSRNVSPHWLRGQAHEMRQGALDFGHNAIVKRRQLRILDYVDKGYITHEEGHRWVICMLVHNEYCNNCNPANALQIGLRYERAMESDPSGTEQSGQVPA